MKKLILLAILAFSIKTYSQNNPIYVQSQHAQHSIALIKDNLKEQGRKPSDFFGKQKSGKTDRYGFNELTTLITLYDSIYSWNWDTLLNDWALDTKVSDIVYDAHNNPTNFTSYTWTGSSWDYLVQLMQTFDAHNNVTSFVYRSWSGIAWVNLFQILSNYDANDNLTSETYQSWNGVAWVGTSKYIYTYDSHNNLMNEVDQIWMSGAWQNDYQYTYTYDANNNEISEIDQSWNGSSWDNDYQYLNTYDAGNHLTSSTGAFWTGVDWYNSSRSNFTYDDNGNLLTRIEQSWDGVSWVNFFKDTYTYNGSNNVTTSLTQTWNGSSWENDYQSLNTFDSNPNLIKTLNQTWGGSAWVNQSVELTSYDDNNFIESESTIVFDSSGLIVISGDSAYYYSHSVVATHDVASEDGSIDAYPNPNDGKFTINSASEMSTLEVYNLLGEKVYSDHNLGQQKQKKIDLTAIGKGIYFLNISDGKQMTNRKIVIQ